jgi:uncharacterized GH25 family protein
MACCRNVPVSILTAGVFVIMMPATNVLAHDFWIEPSAYEAPVEATIALTLRVGQNFGGDRLPYITDWFSDYRAVGAGQEYPIDGVIGDDPAGDFVPRAPGIYVIGYRSTQNFVEMGPIKFDDYLEGEGLDQIRSLRLERGDAGSAGREIYSRCAKSLIRIGTLESGEGFDTLLGYTLELVPEKNPYAIEPGDRLPVRLLYESEPLAGALVIAFTSDRPDEKLEARTNAEGRVEFELPHSGIWLVKAVHMIPAPSNDRRADWESFWASLTFRLPPR